MAWFTNAIQAVRERQQSGAFVDFKERVREQALSIADNVVLRAQQLEVTVSDHLQGNTFIAREVELRLEADAKGLCRTVQASEVLQRWMILLRSNPQPRYPEALGSMVSAGSSGEGDQPGSGTELTFRQIFLHSQALEHALDAVTRVPELRAHLREFAATSPDVWPEEQTPPVAFAHVFVMLLDATIGPPEVWLPLLGALLSSERGPADEPCHAWIIQLLAGLRTPWARDAGLDREHEAEAVEDQARDILRRSSHDGTDVSAGNLAAVLESLTAQGRAAATSYRAWSLRNSLAVELEKAAERQHTVAQMRAGSAQAVASAAAERAVVLESEARKSDANIQELHRTLGVQSAELSTQLESTDVQQLHREIEEAEMTHQELVRQVEAVADRLIKLRGQCSERVDHEKRLRAELQRVNGTLTTRLAVEEQAQHHAEGARAMAATVIDLAQAIADSGKDDSQARDPQIRLLAEEASRHKKKALDSALELAEREVIRLTLAANTVEVSAAVAEEREQSRQALEKAGVPASTLESDVVGEAEIAQSLQTALAEIDRCRSDVEALCRMLEEEKRLTSVPKDSERRASQTAAGDRAQALATQLMCCLAKCDERRAHLTALLPLAVEIDIATPPSEQEEECEIDPMDAWLADESEETFGVQDTPAPPQPKAPTPLEPPISNEAAAASCTPEPQIADPASDTDTQEMRAAPTPTEAQSVTGPAAAAT